MNTIYLIGDSTCQTNKMDTSPQKGWGQYFKNYINGKKYHVINLAKNGASTKTFLEEGRFQPVLDNIKENDILFIEFGHNDEHDNAEQHTDKDKEYASNLKYFASVTLKAKAQPIIMSSISRRNFIDGVLVNTHKGYDKKAIEISKSLGINYVDLSQLTFDYLVKAGEAKSKAYFMNFKPGLYKNYPEGSKDNTHLRAKGAKLICNLIKDSLMKTELKKLFI